MSMLELGEGAVGGERPSLAQHRLEEIAHLVEPCRCRVEIEALRIEAPRHFAPADPFVVLSMMGRLLWLRLRLATHISRLARHRAHQLGRQLLRPRAVWPLLPERSPSGSEAIPNIPGAVSYLARQDDRGQAQAAAISSLGWPLPGHSLLRLLP